MKLPQLSLRELFWLVLVVGIGVGWWVHHRKWQADWNDRQTVWDAERQRWLENLFIEQLVKGGPEEKMVAADRLRLLNCRRAVPFLLVEARDRYPKMELVYGNGGKG